MPKNYVGNWGKAGWVVFGIVLILLIIIIVSNVTQNKPITSCENAYTTVDCKICNNHGSFRKSDSTCNCSEPYTGVKCENCVSGFHLECVAD